MATRGESGSQKSPVTSRKRKHSDEAETGRAIKHRSSQACQSCRKRKVRCDVLSNGSQCTNCRLDHLECVVVASRRGKTNHANRKDVIQPTKPVDLNSPDVPGESDPSTPEKDLWRGGKTVYTPTAGGGGDGHVPVCVTFDEDIDKRRRDQEPTPNETPVNGADSASPEVYNNFLTPKTRFNSMHQYESPAAKVSLPAFINPLSGRITAEDVDFLVQKGALTVPEHELCVEILRAYLFSVHPFMPMLDFRQFVHAVLENREDSRISLLLFQAVMFAGLHSLQLHVIHRLGFQSVKQARRAFFDRVRLLYDFDVETDSAAVLQSLILMSSWYGKSDERRHTWHWTGLAYDVARTMALHREPTSKHTPDKIRRFRRRLWWSLYIRDRLIALGTRRPMRIRDDEFDVAMLTLEDFDLEPLVEFNQGQQIVPNAEEFTSTAVMCIEITKLCVLIGRVVSSQYTVLNNQQDVPPTMMVVSKRNGASIQELESCDKELNEWFRGLGTNVGKNGSSSSHYPQSCSEVHWAILNLTYLTVLNVLHRAQALQPVPEAIEAQAVQSSSRSKVKDAARGLTKVSQTMLSHDQIRFLGPIGVTAVIAACLSHMLDVSSGDADIRDASTFRLYQSLQVLESLREIYPSADASVDFLAVITRKAGIHVPAQIAATTSSTDGTTKPSINLNQTSTWNDAIVMPGRSRDTSNERLSASNADAQYNSYSGFTQSQTMLDRNGHAPRGRGTLQPSPSTYTVTPSTVEFASSKPTSMSIHEIIDNGKGVPNADHGRTQPMYTAYAGSSNQMADGSPFDWVNGVETGMDLESMAFNIDFYSNSFGYFDGNLQRL